MKFVRLRLGLISGGTITLKDGKAFHVIVNYEPEAAEVALGSLRTKQRFATDCSD